MKYYILLSGKKGDYLMESHGMQLGYSSYEEAETARNLANFRGTNTAVVAENQVKNLIREF